MLLNEEPSIGTLISFFGEDLEVVLQEDRVIKRNSSKNSSKKSSQESLCVSLIVPHKTLISKNDWEIACLYRMERNYEIFKTFCSRWFYFFGQTTSVELLH